MHSPRRFRKRRRKRPDNSERRRRPGISIGHRRSNLGVSLIFLSV